MKKLTTHGPHAASLRAWQLRIFWLLWTAYASYYLCRVNFAVAQPLILREFPDWTAAQIGLIPSIYAMCYAVGQIVNGTLGERFGARRLMTMALVGAAATNILFSMTSSFAMMLVLWAINGYAQSAGWSLLIQTLSDWNTSERRGTLVGLISTFTRSATSSRGSWRASSAIRSAGAPPSWCGTRPRTHGRHLRPGPPQPARGRGLPAGKGRRRTSSGRGRIHARRGAVHPRHPRHDPAEQNDLDTRHGLLLHELGALHLHELDRAVHGRLSGPEHKGKRLYGHRHTAHRLARRRRGGLGLGPRVRPAAGSGLRHHALRPGRGLRGLRRHSGRSWILATAMLGLAGFLIYGPTCS